MSAARTKSPVFRRKVPFPVTSPTSPFTFTSPTTSLKNRVVFLHKWWLIKTEPDSHGRRLGVGGLSSHRNQPERCFRSAPIVKRDDNVTFQTVDGVTVLVDGCISRSETLARGFPRKVCEHFQIGFPYDWDEYACMSFDEHENPTTPGDCESGELQQIFDDLMQNIEIAKKESSTSTIPVSPTPVENSRKRNIERASNDILQPTEESYPQVKHVPSAPDETPVMHTKVQAHKKTRHDTANSVQLSGRLTRSKSCPKKESSVQVKSVPSTPEESPAKREKEKAHRKTSDDILQPTDGAMKESSVQVKLVPSTPEESQAKLEKVKAHRITSDDILHLGDSVDKESYPQVKPVPSAPDETPVKHTKVQAHKETCHDFANGVQLSGRLTRSKTRSL